MGTKAWVGVLVLVGCVPELRIVHRDAASEPSDATTSDMGTKVVDASGDVISDTGADGTADARDEADVTVRDVVDAGSALNDAGVDAPLADVAACPAGQTACDGRCVDTERDVRHCGACGRACAVPGSEVTCTAGVCRATFCSAGFGDCDGTATNGCETDLTSSSDHCGGCGSACRLAHATSRCGGGACGIAACEAGWGNCDGALANGCETDLRVTAANCGACGHACAAGAVCLSSVCVAAQRSCEVAGTPGCGLVEVPGATVTLGTDDDCGADAGASTTCAFNASPAQRGITVSRFFVDRDEVTVARFRRWWAPGHPLSPGPVRYPGGSTLPEVTALSMVDSEAVSRCNLGATGREDHPVNCVSWEVAQAFCVWDGGRVPTGSEWEVAARGLLGQSFPWGETLHVDDVTRACWSGSVARTGTCVVGSHPAGNTASGIRDLAGNLAEWTAEHAISYTDARCWGDMPRTDPLCTFTRVGSRAIRGGDWNDTSDASLRAASRSWLPAITAIPLPALASISVGLRCVRSPSS